MSASFFDKSGGEFTGRPGESKGSDQPRGPGTETNPQNRNYLDLSPIDEYAGNNGYSSFATTDASATINPANNLQRSVCTSDAQLLEDSNNLIGLSPRYRRHHGRKASRADISSLGTSIHPARKHKRRDAQFLEDSNGSSGSSSVSGQFDKRSQ